MLQTLTIAHIVGLQHTRALVRQTSNKQYLHNMFTIYIILQEYISSIYQLNSIWSVCIFKGTFLKFSVNFPNFNYIYFPFSIRHIYTYWSFFTQFEIITKQYLLWREKCMYYILSFYFWTFCVRIATYSVNGLEYI